MKSDPELLEKIEAIKELKESLARNKGSMETLQQKLKKEFGVLSVKEAKVLLAEMKTKHNVLSRKLAKRQKKFQKEWDAYKSGH